MMPACAFIRLHISSSALVLTPAACSQRVTLVFKYSQPTPTARAELTYIHIWRNIGLMICHSCTHTHTHTYAHTTYNTFVFCKLFSWKCLETKKNALYMHRKNRPRIFHEFPRFRGGCGLDLASYLLLNSLFSWAVNTDEGIPSH
ncbi:uncharacterized protein GGS25DRAFT_485704 [Hypoxylon fragiforme]|uniref:uncharacterized protein n=1 Tax=Hypoxylon fragiforme TaxID=63214 RepID=UPI0020C609E7|nr:uncharacterized protein GGS25DRAFT_485704 [Hypoxylon fragiforme]KAI2609672.1 hypothetical protein GGS25DRAFT_485704 [Hypoxylon fragiforme]